jgi:hypothetical protein
MKQQRFTQKIDRKKNQKNIKKIKQLEFFSEGSEKGLSNKIYTNYIRISFNDLKKSISGHFFYRFVFVVEMKMKILGLCDFHLISSHHRTNLKSQIEILCGEKFVVLCLKTIHF